MSSDPEPAKAAAGLDFVARDPQSGAVAVLPDDPHNRQLVQHVHPPGWKNPAPGERYNLVVIGGGTAGLVSAIGAAGLGARVALVERHLLGGDCLNYGCVPSKALIRSARAVHEARGLARFGAESGQLIAPDFAAVTQRMRGLRAGIAHHDSAQRFTQSGVDVYLGDAQFASPSTVRVGRDFLQFRKAVIATGGRAVVPPVPGLLEVGYLTNESVFSLTVLPRRLAVLGAGPIGCELAQAFRRLGSDVTLLTTGSRILPKEDPDAAHVVQERFNDEGVEVRCQARLQRVSRDDRGKSLEFERGGQRENVIVDEILVAVGRAPQVEGLNLDAASVSFDGAGVSVDDHLRTTNPDIYAAGDICSKYKFTHAADAMARIAIQNSLFMGRKRVSALVVPWATYTDPEIAHVGLYEAEAKERGLPVRTFTIPLRDVDRAVLDGETEGFARLHVDMRTGKILGASVVASHAGEMIGEVVLAMNHGLGAGALSQAIHPYPTQSEAWKRLGDAYSRTRLKPWLKRVFERYFRWLRD